MPRFPVIERIFFNEACWTSTKCYSYCVVSDVWRECIISVQCFLLWVWCKLAHVRWIFFNVL